jgi:hypothetical protein
MKMDKEAPAVAGMVIAFEVLVSRLIADGIIKRAQFVEELKAVYNEAPEDRQDSPSGVVLRGIARHIEQYPDPK